MNSSTFLLYVSLFPLFILPVLLQFLSLCVQLTLFPVHFFVAVIFIQQLVPMTQFNFAFPIPLHIHMAMIVVSIFPLNSTPPFLSHLVSLLYFVFIVIPFTTYSINFPFLFYISLVLPVPPFCPFPISFLCSH